MFRFLTCTLIAAGVFMAPAPALTWGTTPFCRGWDEGYKDGYCYKDFACLDPLVPLCPLPNMNEDSFRDGYNRGFLAGLGDKQK